MYQKPIGLFAIDLFIFIFVFSLHNYDITVSYDINVYIIKVKLIKYSFPSLPSPSPSSPKSSPGLPAATQAISTSARSKNKCLLDLASGLPPHTLHLGFCKENNNDFDDTKHALTIVTDKMNLVTLVTRYQRLNTLALSSIF